MKTKTIIPLILYLICMAVSAQAKQPEWRIIKTKYPTADIVVAGFNVLEFGADPEGRSDCTPAFQNAMDAMRKAGGGTVFVPEGRYAFKGNLRIPVSVTLRGEWRAPTKEDPSVQGSLLMPLAGRGEIDGEPFITVDYCAGIKDMNIWYPQQSATRPIPYPYCLIQQGGNNASFENLTLVNPYQGIRIGPGANELHMIRNVYGTPLKTGIQYDSTTDIGRLQTIRFSPLWWCRSGLPKSPRSINWLRKNGTALHMLRSDWEYVADVEVDGYECGFRISEGVRGAANAQFYHLIIRDCETAMEVEKTNPFGMVFTECLFEGSEAGLKVDEKFDSCLLFSTCLFAGKDAIVCEGNGKILMEQCRILRGNLEFDQGAYSLLDTRLETATSLIRIGSEVAGIILEGNSRPGQLPAVRVRGNKNSIMATPESPPLIPIPDYSVMETPVRRPSGERLIVVPPGGNDDTQAIQQALDQTAADGGGIVFLPAGDYFIRGRITVPGGVELRGIHDVPHHTMGGGSILHVYTEGEDATIVLESDSGIRGISSNYPEQNMADVKTYPFFIQGQGSDIYVINVNSANPYQFIDFMSHRCDRHYIEYPSGAPLKTGIAVGGGSTDGYVGNMQLNPHYAVRVPGGNKLFTMRGSHKPLWEFQKENLDALVIGDCSGEFLFQNFVYGSLYGIHFTGQDGKGAVNCISHGHGTDGSKVGCFFEFGHGTISMINTELVAMSSRDKTAIKTSEGFDSEATLINTMVWGSPDLLADIGNGMLTLQNLHANRHGRGMHMSKGTLHALNLSFNENGSHLQTEGGTVRMTGFITNGPFLSVATDAEPTHVIEWSR